MVMAWRGGIEHTLLQLKPYNHTYESRAATYILFILSVQLHICSIFSWVLHFVFTKSNFVTILFVHPYGRIQVPIVYIMGKGGGYSRQVRKNRHND